MRNYFMTLKLSELMFTWEEQYFVDREGDTDNEVFPLGIEAMEAEELVSD